MAKGAAWTVPVIAIGAAAPSATASPACQVTTSLAYARYSPFPNIYFQLVIADFCSTQFICLHSVVANSSATGPAGGATADVLSQNCLASPGVGASARFNVQAEL